jgi:hypothetical protein
VLALIEAPDAFAAFAGAARQLYGKQCQDLYSALRKPALKAWATTPRPETGRWCVEKRFNLACSNLRT